ncbi:MAG TPA: hypothetical protein VFU63_09775 [Ktedonobacterales bacterium]|nr:hypothetical protein [Ktedonobacterales bacterium]
MATNLSVAVPSCHECGIQSVARCPECHCSLCLDHFPREEHEPCATQLRNEAIRFTCYVCGAPALPQQWSSASFAHYIDPHTCAGCGRHICDQRHTRLLTNRVDMTHDGMRSQRYNITQRYCDICAPFRHIGGLPGALRWLVGVGGIIVAGVLVYVELLPH